jgi:uncharacterized delta-60 repeat protein
MGVVTVRLRSWPQGATAIGIAAVALLVALGAPATAAAGDLDPTFGVGGKVTVSGLNIYAMALQPDGKIVVAGVSLDVFGLARLNPDGSVDASFGTGGMVTTDFGAVFEAAYAVTLLPDGRIVAAGTAGEGGRARDLALARYNPDGSLDASFDSDGRVTTSFGVEIQEAYDVLVQPDGRIVAAGFAAGGFAPGGGLALARYNSDGSLDASFDFDGRVTTDFGNGTDYATAVVLQPDGRIVAAGLTQTGGTDDFALARYNSDGSLDPTFGVGGTVTTDLGGFESAYDAVLQPDGNIVAVGPTGSGSTPTTDFALLRYNPDGSLDPGFGSGGRVTTDFAGDVDIPSAVALQPDGRIVAAGLTETATGDDFALARYEDNGSLDVSFGSGGRVTTDLGGFESADAAVLQPDGKIVVGGVHFVLRYLGDGANTAPTVGITGGQCHRDAAASARLDLAVGDVESPADALTVSATSSNQELIPSDALVLGGSGATRTLDLTAVPRRAGSTVVTVAVTDGAITTTLEVTVRVDGPGGGTLAGTAGPDVVFGLTGADTLDGRGGNDLVCGGGGDDRLDGGNGDDVLAGGGGADRLDGGSGRDRLLGGTGDDVLTGGPLADLFSGGSGSDAATDFAPFEGDTQDGTIP